jgi:hypothetical protein
MALPVAKLGTLALRTLSKPIASRLKSQAAVHPKFRNFIIAIAQVTRHLPNWRCGSVRSFVRSFVRLDHHLHVDRISQFDFNPWLQSDLFGALGQLLLVTRNASNPPPFSWGVESPMIYE